MKIGIVTTSFKPYEWFSGISNAAFLMAKEMNEKYDAEITVFAPEDGKEKKFEEHENLTIQRFSMIDISAKRGFYISPELLNMLKKSDLDIIHSFHYGYFPATAGLMAAKRKNIPHIFTAAYHPVKSIFKRSLMEFYNLSQGRFVIGKSAAVLPFNNDEKRKLRAIANGNFDVTPVPINHKTFSPATKKGGKLTLAFVGAMELWKGPRVAFDLFKEIEKERDDVNFIFVGNGDLDHQRKLFRTLKNNSGRRFSFRRNLTATQLADTYRKADILVSPTSYESFGCVMAEAMLCGTPVVSTKVGAVPETVGKGGILVDYGDWPGMKKSIHRILDDKNLRKKLARNALGQSKNYRDDVVTKKIFDIYNDAIK